MTFTIPNEADAAITDQAEIDSGDFQILNSANIFDGVIAGCGVTWTSGMTVRVATGQVSVQGFFPFIPQTDLTVTAPASGARFDLICVDYNGVVSRVVGTLSTTNPVFPAIPANNIVLASLYVLNTDVALAANRLIDKRMIIQNLFEQEMELVNSRDGSGSSPIGELGWYTVNVAGSGNTTAALSTGVSSHPGILSVGVTSGASGDRQCFSQSQTNADAVLLPTSISRMRAIIRMTLATQIMMRFGISDGPQTNATANAWGSNAVFFEYNWTTTAGDFYCVTRSAAANTNADSGVLGVANNWFDLEIVRLQNGNWQFVINKSIVVTSTSNLPTVAGQMALLVANNTTSARSVDVDYIGYNLSSLGQRYT